MKISREVKTALLVLSGIALFIYGYSFLKGTSLFERNKIIYTVYDEVEGLVSGAKVSINGLSIGRITNIDFLPNTTRILITMSIREELEFSKESTAQLYETGLIGGKAIAIQPVFDLNNKIVSGDTLVSEVKPGLTELINRQIEPLQAKIESMLTSADSLFSGVSNVLDNNTQVNFKEDKKIRSIRHTIRPSISYSSAPSFEQYYDEYIIDADGNTREYTAFEGGLFGTPSRGISKSIGISVSNNFEAKVVDPDTTKTELKKIQLLKNLNFSTSYNFTAIIEISTLTFLGSVFTATVSLAGAVSFSKYFP